MKKIQAHISNTFWSKRTTNTRDILLFHGCSLRQVLQIFCLNMQYVSRLLGLFFFLFFFFSVGLLWSNQIKFILLLFKAEHLFSFSPETGLLLISSLLEAFRWRKVARKGERSTPSLSLLNTSLSQGSRTVVSEEAVTLRQLGIFFSFDFFFYSFTVIKTVLKEQGKTLLIYSE